jgi:hypothetical protein
MTEQNPPPIVGAKAKIDRAAFLRAQGYFGAVNTKQKKKTSRAVIVTIIYAFAYIYAFLIMDAIESRVPQLVQLVKITGNPSIDYILIIVSIASVTMLLAGLIPALAYIWNHLMQNPDANVYLTVWAVTVVLLIVSFFLPTIISGFSSVIGVFG